MKIVYVGVSLAELKAIADPIGEGMGKAFVELIFDPMIVKGSCKKVRK